MLDESGNEKWMFESYDFEKSLNSIDAFVFWYGQIFNCLFWAFILFIKILTLAPFWVGLAGDPLVRRLRAVCDKFVRLLQVPEGLPEQAEEPRRRDHAEHDHGPG